MSPSKNASTERESIGRLRARPSADVLIIGGGINGIATFRDLALQGVDVALVERGDFVSGASSASSHMVHGGIRYLENGEFRLVQEAVTDRQRDFVVGKVAGDDVRTPGGVLIVAKGATISDMQASYAEREGVLPALVAAAGQGSVGQGVRGLLSDPGPTPVGASVGRRVLEDVRSPVGGLLAVQGQIVTPTIAERARELGIEDRLYAATQTQAAGVGEGLREGATEVRDQLADGLSSIAQGTEQLLGRARAWLGDKREEVEGALTRQEQEAHQARIRDALGRPVRRAVLTTTDRVILHPGEYVTHAALDEARAAGVLDLLLDSVEDTGPV